MNTAEKMEEKMAEATYIEGRKNLEAAADKAAQKLLHLPSRKEAFAMLDRGELRDTAVEAHFKGLRFVLSE